MVEAANVRPNFTKLIGAVVAIAFLGIVPSAQATPSYSKSCHFGDYGSETETLGPERLRITSTKRRIDGYAPLCLVAESVADGWTRVLKNGKKFRVMGARWDGGYYACIYRNRVDAIFATVVCRHSNAKYRARVNFRIT